MKHYQPDWSEQPEEWHEPRQESRLLPVRWLAVVITLVWIGAIVLFLTGLARAHHVPGTDGLVYDRGCCNSAATHPYGDCAPIDDQYVTERADGYHIDIPAGAHPKLKNSGYSGVVPYGDEDVQQPIDNRYHICLGTNGSVRFCFYPKPGAV